jgi:hypothetical protein
MKRGRILSTAALRKNGGNDMEYDLPGDKAYQERIYPDPAQLDPDVRARLRTYEGVIADFTLRSLKEDGIEVLEGSLRVAQRPGNRGYAISFEPQPQFARVAEQFAWMHVRTLDEHHAGLALAGADACQRTAAWNPMAGYPVKPRNPNSEWIPCLPLGMPIANHRAVVLLHYPPIVAYRTADYLNNNTLRRWAQLLNCVGIDQPQRYHAIVDVIPIAAPGSGESEYPNDYLPINLTSLFFDNNNSRLSYVRSMLDLMLDPPANRENPFTLPLLVCGSPVYDPQAPGWFRVRYKGDLPKPNGVPIADVLQAGTIKISPDSPKPTPYMIANHMIAAGVMGACTDDPSNIPNIQKFEAQDLVAASFLAEFEEAARHGHEIAPDDARRAACRRWFGAPDGTGAPAPPNEDDRLTLCAMAQWDLCFDPIRALPKYTYAEAKERCRRKGGSDYSPCFGCGELLMR